MPASRSSADQAPELVITRVFHAPRQLVFDAWTRPEHLQHWQAAPRGFVVITKKSDIRPGGAFDVSLRAPDGTEHSLRGMYREVESPERISFTHQWLDQTGRPGVETLVTITLREHADGTELTLRQTGFASIGARDGHREGWSSALDVLGDYLAAARVA